MSSSNHQLTFVRSADPRSANRRLLRLCLPACALAFASMGVASPTLARDSFSFDGNWSVVIETRSGNCTPTLRYPIAISHGIVTNAGENAASVSGRVTPAGAVSVIVQSGGASAAGSGRLGTTSGTGIWRGQGSSGICVGTWQAERRSHGAQALQRGGPVYNSAREPARRYYRPYSPYYSPY